MEALFWWEPSPPLAAGPHATLSAEDVQVATHSTSVSFLGRGSFGETWRTTDRAGHVRAVKIVLNEQYPQALLQREVRGLQRVTDPRVVALHEVQTLELSVGRRAALVFEFVDGGDTTRRIASHGWPTHYDVRGFLRELLGAVAALHAVETVHRDIKPENIALRGSSWEAPVLLDLGLAKLLNVESFTQYPTLMGTLAFMAPEQVRQEPARKAADIWAIGVVAHVLLAREHPFYDGRSACVTTDEALKRMKHGPRPLPGSIPPDIAGVVSRLLEYEPHRRGSASRAVRELQGDTT